MERREMSIPPFFEADVEAEDTQAALKKAGRIRHVQAALPEQLKRRLFVILALRQETFTGWLQEQAAAWLAEHERSTRQAFLEDRGNE